MTMIVPHLIFKKDHKILLTRRANTQKLWASHWHCVCGSIEEGETPREAIIREAQEEVGIKIVDLKLATTISLKEKDYFDPSKIFYALDLFFLSHLTSDQIPVNREPLKQDAMDWFDIDNLPHPMIPCVQFGLESYFEGINYAEFRNNDL